MHIQGRLKHALRVSTPGDTAWSLFAGAELIAARQPQAAPLRGKSSDVSRQQYKFSVSEGPLTISESQMLLSSAAGCCLLAPALQSGNMFYLRFEIQHFSGLPGDELFLGITTNTDPGGLWLDTDAGWFLQDSHHYNRKLTGGQEVCNGPWSKWQQGDQPVFKVDLVNYTLHVQLGRLHVEYTARIQGSPVGDVFFCVTMHSANITKVKLLPVLPEHMF